MIQYSTLFIPNKFQCIKIDETFFKDQLTNIFHESFKKFLKANPPNTSLKLYSNAKSKKDYSIYSGTGGNIYVFWRYHLLSKIKEFKDDYSLKYLKDSFEANLKLVAELEKSKEFNIFDQDTSFYHGPVGIYTMGCILAQEIQDESMFIKNLKLVLKYKIVALSDYSEDELLYGNAGYLYSLCLIYKNIIDDEIFKTHLTTIEKDMLDVIQYLYEVGSNKRKEHNTNFMVYPFPRIESKKKSSKFYFGGAHGIFGVLYEMLNAIDLLKEIANERLKIIKTEIKNDLMELSKLQFATGNFPSSLNKPADNLIQFCHGATGAVFLYGLAYKMYREDIFLEVASRCGDAIWERGLLKKGNGICHGITGNAYGLYYMYKITNNKEWLYKAHSFSLATFDENIQNICKDNDPSQRLIKGIPDTPFSLMEGQGGTICLYSDILNDVENVKFPGYEP